VDIELKKDKINIKTVFELHAAYSYHYNSLVTAKNFSFNLLKLNEYNVGHVL